MSHPIDAVFCYPLPVDFEIEHENFDLAKFQAEGHFVCGLKDENGFRREWATDEVHVITLRYQGKSPLYAGKQILRVMSDTVQGAEQEMQRTIRETLLSLWTASQSTTSSYQDWLALNERRNQFQMWLNAQYSYEIQTGQHQHLPTVFDVAVWYMRKERQRLGVRLARLLRREKATQMPAWVPEEWRQ